MTDAFRPTLESIARALAIKITHHWHVIVNANSFSTQYMDSEGVPRTAVFDRDALHIAEQLWAEKEGL